MNNFNQNQPPVKELISQSYYAKENGLLVYKAVVTAIRDLKQVAWLYIKTTKNAANENVEWIAYPEFIRQLDAGDYQKIKA